jgi:Pyridoxamine 5'-phosphate oxidase
VTRVTSVRMPADEAWQFVEDSHTGVFTSMRMDGMPVALPVWYVVENGVVWLTTPSRSKKVSRVRANPATSFLVESGIYWTELKAVQFGCTATVFTGDPVARIEQMKNVKYAAFRAPRSTRPAATRKHYEDERVAIRLEPSERLVTWDNSRLAEAR